MAFQPSEGLEPFEGYKLVKRLGGGGYGEVWLATAPGGLEKAIKFVYGNIDAAQAEQELKALRRIKEVRHPFLLSLERFEITTGQLIIVTELADASLFDYFKECQSKGLPGIPRDELLVLIGDAADALDYMNEHHGLQHLDIKPQNLLMVARRVKVADFGLVKQLEGNTATATGGVTPVYATPEAFDGRVSRFSDQYSLAIVYQEMLTGIRPFAGATALQLAVQHMYSPPFLDPLPPNDRPIVARALSKSPEQRFASCRQMVDALRTAGGMTPLPGTPSPSMAAIRQAVRSATPVAHVRTVPSDQEPISTSDQGRTVEVFGRQRLTPVVVSQRLQEIAMTPGRAVLRPTLVLGVGGLAARTLRKVRQRLSERFGDPDTTPIFRLLLLDADREQLRAARTGDRRAALDLDETVLTPLHSPDHYRNDSKDLLRWIERRWLFGIPRSLTTEGVRPLGRLALVDNADAIEQRVREAIAQLARPRSQSETTVGTGLGLRDETPRVFFVTTISGGAGSGMFLDLAYIVRRIFADLGMPTDGLIALLGHATSRKPAQKELSRLCARAAIQELAHFLRGSQSYPGDETAGLPAGAPGQPPFAETYLVHLGDELGDAEIEAAADMLAEYVYLDAASGCGAVFDQHRRASRNAQSIKPAVRSLGLHRIGYPRFALASLTSQLICRSLIGYWLGEGFNLALDDTELQTPLALLQMRQAAVSEDPLRQLMAAETEQWVRQLGLDAEAIVVRLSPAAEQLLGVDPETRFSEFAADLQRQANPDSPIAALPGVLQSVHAMLGMGTSVRENEVPVPSRFELEMARHAKQLGQALSRTATDWIMSQLNLAGRRVGGAQYAADCLLNYLESTQKTGQQRKESYSRERRLLAARLVGTDDAGRARWFPLPRRAASDTATDQQLLRYCWQRYSEVLFHESLNVLGTVAAAVGICKERLVAFRQSFSRLRDGFDPTPPRTQADASANVTELLPGGAENLAQAAQHLLERLGQEFLHLFDAEFQTAVLDVHGGLHRLDLDNRDVAEAMHEELLARARSAVLEATIDINAARLFFDRYGRDEEAPKELLARIESARPRLATRHGQERLLLFVPADADGVRIRDIVTRALPNILTKIQSSENEFDVVICFEAVDVALADAADALTGAEPDYAVLSEKMHARIDVAWTDLAAPNA